MSKSRLEKFLYALYSLNSSDLPNPLSRIEELYKCLVTGDEAPTFEPLSRVEKYLMAILGVYDVDSLPNPLSRVEVLLHKLATGDDNLDDVEMFLSEHEELLAEIIRNGGVGGNIEYVLYALSTEFNTLYNTAEKPVKSAILKGNTDENLQSVKMPVLTTTGKNLLDKNIVVDEHRNHNYLWTKKYKDQPGVSIKPNTNYSFSLSDFKGDGKIILWSKGNKSREVNILSPLKGGLFTTNSTEDGFSFYASVTNGDDAKTHTAQLEESSSITPYEPFKSNILTANEDVELRGVGEIKDELDCLTGEVIRKLGKVTFNGGENWQDADNALSNTHRFQATISAFKSNAILSNDRGFNNITSGTSYVDTKNIQIDGGFIFIRTLRSEVDSLDDLKSFLSSNPLTIIGELNVGTVSETVDLSVVDQDGNDTKLSTFNDITHVTLSSEGLIPEAELKVATKNEEVLSTMSLEMDDISATQTTLEETSNTQSENVDATMFATTEIYEGLL